METNTLSPPKDFPAKSEITDIRPLLGTMPDAELARRSGVKCSKVSRLRIAAGIPTYDPLAHLRRPEVEAAIGNMPDSEVVRRFNLECACGTVTQYRIKHLKRPAFLCSERMELTQREIDMLGTDTDEEVARRIGICRDVVGVWRRRLGIPRVSRAGSLSVPWEPEEEALLGTDTDAAVAGRINRSAGAVAQRRRFLSIPPFRGQGSGARRRADEIPIPVAHRNHNPRKKKDCPRAPGEARGCLTTPAQQKKQHHG